MSKEIEELNTRSWLKTKEQDEVYEKINEIVRYLNKQEGDKHREILE